MFDKELRNLVDELTPKVNPDIANGLVTSHIKHGVRYLEGVWKVVAESLPEGMEYVSCRKLNPDEEYALRTRRASSRPPQIDLARCDLRYMVFNLTYDGQPLDPVYLQVPFVSDGGTLWLSGSRYIYSPVLADRCISVNKNGIFVRLLQTKINFNRDTYFYAVNCHDRHYENVAVVWGKIWNGNADSGSNTGKVSGFTTVAHYLFAKYGVPEVFKKFANAEVFYGDEFRINEEQYPRSDWIICSSANIQMTGRRRKFSEPNVLKLAIRKQDYNVLTKALIAGVFYVTDRFTSRLDYMNIERTSLWRIMLGYMLFGDRTDGALLNDIDEHLLSMDKYVDAMVIRNLERQGYVVSDIYQLFVLILSHITEWIISNDVHRNSVYEKELSTLYSLYFDITASIFHLVFELKKQIKRSGKLTLRQVNEKLKFVKAGVVFGLKSGHGEMTVDDYVGSNKLMKITTTMTPQNRANSGRGQRVAMSDPSLCIHHSWVRVYGISSMTKASPTGDTRLSPYIKIDADGRIIHDDPFKDLIDHIGENLRSKNPVNLVAQDCSDDDDD